MADLERLAGPDHAPERHVIFIHGLDGDLRETWRSRSPENISGSGWKSWLPFFGAKPAPEQTAGELWPEWLASDIVNLAIWSVGFPAAISNWTGEAMYLTDRAANVYDRLLAEDELADGELIFVGHSFGGLVIKQLLRKASDEAQNNRRAKAGNLIERTRKVAFLATPHNGADLAVWADRLRLLSRPSETVISLAKNDPGLRDLNRWYRGWAGARDIDHLILVENEATHGVVVVTPDSADPGLSQSATPIDADHLAIAKPASRSNEVYVHVRNFITRAATTYVSPEERAIERVGDDTQAIREKVEQLINEDSVTDQQREELVADLAKIKAEHNGTIELVASFLETMVGKKVPPTEFASTLFKIVADWKSAGKKIDALTFSANSQSHFGALRDEARAAHRAGRLDEAERLLARIAQLEVVALERLEAHRKEIDQEIKMRRKGAAETKFAQAAVAHARLDYLAAAALYGEAARFIESYDKDAYVNALLAQASELFSQGDEFGNIDALKESIRLYRFCIDKIPSERATLHWASIQNNLGNALFTLGNRESGTTSLRESVEAYRNSLFVWNKLHFPLLWATAQNNLGASLLVLGQRETGKKQLEEAIIVFRNLLLEWTQFSAPLDWAATQVNMGVTLKCLGERESETTRLEEAVEAYSEALKVYTREKAPLAWAATHSNLASALMLLGERKKDMKLIEQSVGASRAALTVQTRERFPIKWANTQNTLGNALQTLSEYSNDSILLKESVEAYRSALMEQNRDCVPLDWARTKYNLGTALICLDEEDSASEWLEKAVETFTSALAEWTQEFCPYDWAAAQNNLGIALLRLGKRESDRARLEEAVEAFQQTLKEITQQLDPVNWATTQSNLGEALLILGERERSATRLQESFEAFAYALKVRTQQHTPLDWATSYGSQGVVLMLIAERKIDVDLAAQAVEQINQAYKTCLSTGHAPNAEYFETKLTEARRLLDRLRGEM